MANPLESLCVVLVSPRNPLNIGAAARAMSNFGCFQLRLVTPYGPSYSEARSAVGAAPLLQKAAEYAVLADAVADCQVVVGTTAARDRDLQHPLRTLEQGGKLIRAAMVSGRVALVFGSEKRGLSNNDFSHCHWLMRIPTRDEHSSMNLGQAVAVCLYELSRGWRNKRSVTSFPSATSAQQERITLQFVDALLASGYIKTGATSSTEKKVRRLVRGMALKQDDADALQGMLRKVVWKLDH